MEGYNVLYPIGFDAFGLPAENYAIKNHVHPKITTEKNVNHFREQLKALGFHLTGLEKSIQLIQIIINGLNGFLFNYINMD